MYNGGVVGKANIPTTAVATGVWNMRELFLARRQNIWPFENASADPYFEYVSMLLNTGTTNGAQNNTFLDASTNNFTITRNGDTTQGSFNPYMPSGYWSSVFRGTNADYVGVPANAAFSMTGDFTLEAWVLVPAGTTQTNFSSVYNGAAATNTSLYTNFSGSNVFGVFSSSPSFNISSGVTSADGQWHHLAVVRIGSTVTLYVDGISKGAATTSATIDLGSASSGRIGAGSNGASDNPFAGYISNLRIIKGTAVYTAAFTPPTTPLTAITNTSLLCLQDNRFKDNSTNNFTITRNGDTRISKFAPFNPPASWDAATYGGSGYFDGTGDFLAIPDNAALEPGSSDLTWEMWVNTTASNQYATIYGRGTTWAAGSWLLLVNNASATAGDVAVWVNNFSAVAPLLVSTGVNVRDAAWHHIAVVRNGSAWTLYVDGVSRATATWAGTVSDRADGPNVARDPATPTTRDFPGYISNLRVVKGTAVYTGAFTPPTTPLTAITNTSLLLNFTNAGIYDASTINDLQTVGNAQVSTTQAKFGTTSMYFDGTGDWLTIIDKLELRFGTAPFTVEFFVYLGATGAARGLVAKGTSTTGWLVSTDASNKVVFTFTTSTITSTAALSGSQWYHIAVVREGTGSNQTKIYIDGVNDGTGTVSTNFNQTSIAYVGANRTGGDALNGYIDELRITNGYARYTGNFTPPSAPFQTQ